jgi:ABC-type glycerol-3-phosphate transport system substrate-binding protein
LVTCIDEGKNFADTQAAISEQTITEEQYNAVAEARGVFYDWGVPAQIVVNSYSPNVDLAKLFLKYIASDDAAQRAYAASTLITPYASSAVDYKQDESKYTNFMKSIDEIRKGTNSSYIYRIALDKRAEYMLGFFNRYTTLELTWLTKSTLTVDTVLNDEMEFIKELWASNVR